MTSIRRRTVRAALLGAVVAAFQLQPMAAYSGVRILCLGDSLTEGHGVEPEHSFPARLERRLRESGHATATVVNAGISGSTTASAVSRLKWQLRARPDILILALGANDGLRGLAIEQTRKNLDDAIVLAQERGVKVLLAGMRLPPNYGPVYTREFAGIFSELALKRKVALIPFLLKGVAARPALNQPDGIHPTAHGYEIITETVYAFLLPLL